jgi:transposase-like protein
VEPIGHRRVFSPAYKARIVAQADACERGEIGALLRREGLYCSTLQRWRQQRDAGTLEGLTPKKRGPSPDPDRALRQRVAQLEKENQRLAKRLSNAELVIDVQKKVASLLGIALAASDLDEGDKK